MMRNKVIDEVMSVLAIHPLLLVFPVAEPWGSYANLSFGANVHGGRQVAVHSRRKVWKELRRC